MKTRTRPVRQVLLLLLIVGCFSAFYLGFYNLLSTGRVLPKTVPFANLVDYLYNLIPILVLTLCNLLIVFRLWNGTRIEKHLPVKVIADFVVAFAVLYLVDKLYVVLALRWHFNPRVDYVGSILCDLLLLMGIEIVYYIRRSREALRKAEYAKREALQYRYDALKAQVNPHFLFNALNMQVALISLDPERAIEYTSELSQVYRYILSIQNKSRISLAEELEFLRSYIAILEMRYNNSFHVEVCNAEHLTDKYIVPNTLQLLIENVTKHNVVSAKYPMTVTIRVGDDRITVSNPIRLKETATSSGIGLRYIAQQYRLQGKAFATENDGVTFTALIPCL